MMDRLRKKEKCTSVTVKNIMEKLLEKDEREEYVGVKLYYFKKKYMSLERRGL